MKDSGVPPNWKARRLKFAAIVNPVKSEVAHLPIDTQVSFVPMDNIGEYGGIRLDVEKSIEDVYTGYTYFKDGDVVIAKITPCFENGKCAIATGLKNGIGFGTIELHVVRADRKHSMPEFLFYYSISHKFNKMGEAEMYGAGGQKRVPDSYVRNERLYLPPLDEQRAIAAFLDHKTAQIDALIDKKRRMIELLKEKRTALISHAVTKGLNPDARMKDSGAKWMGMIPAHWELKKLKFLSKSIKTGKTPASESAEYYSDEIDWYGPGDFSDDATVLTESKRRVSQLAIIKREAPLFKANSVLLVSIGATLGKVGLIRSQASSNQQINAITPNDDTDPVFLMHFLHVVRKQVWSLAMITTLPILNQEKTGIIEVITPPHAEQIAIGEYIRVEAAKIDRLISSTQHAIQKLQEYRTAVISAAVTGRIDVRNNGAA
ncbi:restriction endonuclease subunit S [Turneriella parva]|uniref:Restriction modification system DNA specificity domain-containing protein n=1 Tax=Turneriella parva (strain ATCC BAA-1111 / DSM 21527 / NCTC 11395 / H) TaxID=869212 RepID=I4B0B1_TURPD|nr:restriction endonuclease subunit S [Turneriella parva]AFM10718.1 restriction modification system DNA specificity domain-containing protein [Turneriella parva DSM 21527]